MRIIAGTLRGRRLHGPSHSSLRPTSDKVREALFSILGPRLLGCRFLDLYAGTGAIAIEALSRGAASATCVEPNPSALKVLRRNMMDCGVASDLFVCPSTAQHFLSHPALWQGPYDIIFADPPYALAEQLEGLLAHRCHATLFAADAWLIVEHATKTPLPHGLGPCLHQRTYRYGDTTLSLYACAMPAPS
ncbi:MAG: 16S rRNA (guanine(966)-N(2))-methyltransferase RsmD [Nitrospira sp.]|nr:16S rRNA (guanine(966)-N(2))-methyltransferase RsmD [Nitrospira sp.]